MMINGFEILQDYERMNDITLGEMLGVAEMAVTEVWYSYNDLFRAGRLKCIINSK